jgi:hypothetical protein
MFFGWLFDGEGSEQLQACDPSHDAAIPLAPRLGVPSSKGCESLSLQEGASLIVHVYDVPGFRAHNNSILGWFRFGVFHVEVEVHGTNYAFLAKGAKPVSDLESLSVPGIIVASVAPGSAMKAATWRCSAVVGSTRWSPSQVASKLNDMRSIWMQYNVLHANCQDFAADFVDRASGGQACLPSWVRNSAQNLAMQFVPKQAALDTSTSWTRVTCFGSAIADALLGHPGLDTKAAGDMDPEVVRALAECKLQLLELLFGEAPGHESSIHALALLVQLVRWSEGNPPTGALDIPDCLLAPFVSGISCSVEPESLSMNLVDHLPSLCKTAGSLSEDGIAAPATRLAWASVAIASRCCLASQRYLRSRSPPRLHHPGDAVLISWRAIAWPETPSRELSPEPVIRDTCTTPAPIHSTIRTTTLQIHALHV